MKIKHMFILLAASVSTASCGFLDEYDPNATTVGNFYKSEADIVLAQRRLCVAHAELLLHEQPLLHRRPLA